MAKKDKVDLSFLNPSLNKNLATSVQSNFDTAYKQTYFSNSKDAKNIEALRRMADRDLNALMDRTKMRNNGHSISDLYARTMAFNDDDTIMEFKHALQDESMLADLMDMYSQNAVQRDLDREIDVVCKYVPKLEEALDIKADHVLCADHFNQDSITITPITTETGKNDIENIDSQYSAKSDIDTFKKKYRLRELTDELYRKTAKYGEQFVYIVAYNKAIKRLMRKNNNAQLLAEDTVITEEAFNDAISSMNESFIVSYAEDENEPLNEEVLFSDTDEIQVGSENWDNIEVEINTTGIIPGIIYEAQNTRRIVKETSALFEDEDITSLNEARKLGVNNDHLLSNNSYLKNMKTEFKKFSKPGGKLKSPTKLDMDGFTDRGKAKKDKDDIINVPGCVVRLLDHTMVKILRIDETILGYYFIECNRDMDTNQTTFSSTLGGLKPRRSVRDRENMDRPPMDDQVLMKVARQISRKIDAKFVNSNQDLVKEIYTILKYNADHGDGKVSKIRVSFLPPNDVVHVYFDINKKTWRGKSDLQKSLFPAKLLSCLYISNTIALLTRGYDKRIYQVRQTVDTNIQAVLLSVINQIKQSNFNLRQIENMNNILNVTGRFNDLVIPQNVNGEAPVNFEVLPGQNIEIKTEFMNMLEEMAINLTGVSLEMVNTRLQEQTATHITMTNSRFLIKIHDRQVKYQDFLSEIFTKIYQNEYGIEDELEVKLPPPAMLNFTNTSQLITAANELIQNIVLMKIGSDNQNEALKSELTSGLMEFYFKTFLPMEDINKIYDDAMINLSSNAERIAMRQQVAQQAMSGGMGGGAPQGGGGQF